MSGSMLEKYVNQFNQQDEETIIQHISNADALSWMEENVPCFECPDKMIEETYYFRWWVYRKHIKSTPEGYIITEFLPNVYWAGKYNSINCAAGHHLNEGRWLRNGDQYLEDYIRFWLQGSGNVRSYSTWIADAVYQYCITKGEFTLAIELLPELVENYWQWEKYNKHASGLFWSVDDRDAMECSVSGNGLRPTLNSYLYADARAISNIARIAGNSTYEDEFGRKAENLKRLIQEKLWDPQAVFFKVFPLESKETRVKNWNFTNVPVEHNVREELGFIPWYFELPDAGYEKAWMQINDGKGFMAPYGPTTAEQRHPRFMEHYGHECLWNGPSWPFATTQTIVAMANVLKDYRQDFMTREDFFRVFKAYTLSHFRTQESGERVNWIDEDINPYTGEWISRDILKNWNWREDKGGYERGKDYNHSGYCDLIIHNLIGIEPQEDGGLRIRPLIPKDWEYFRLEGLKCQERVITVTFDRAGDHYQNESGFRVWCDGICIHESEEITEVIYAAGG